MVNGGMDDWLVCRTRSPLTSEAPNMDALPAYHSLFTTYNLMLRSSRPTRFYRSPWIPGSDYLVPGSGLFSEPGGLLLPSRPNIRLIQATTPDRTLWVAGKKDRDGFTCSTAILGRVTGGTPVVPGI